MFSFFTQSRFCGFSTISPNVYLYILSRSFCFPDSQFNYILSIFSSPTVLTIIQNYGCFRLLFYYEIFHVLHFNFASFVVHRKLCVSCKTGRKKREKEKEKSMKAEKNEKQICILQGFQRIFSREDLFPFFTNGCKNDL